MKRNCIIGQSGGPTIAINASLAGIIAQAKEKEFEHVYGMIHGIMGFLDQHYIDLLDIFKTEEDLERLMHTPSMFLGSCRYKLPQIENHEETYQKIFDLFHQLNITDFFYIGGNDSMDTVMKLSQYAHKIDSPIHFIGVPKTIDNDLVGTDHTPGFGSAAKYVASSILEMVHDSMIYRLKYVLIVEIMGRDAGWLAASSVLARNAYSQAPDLIYLPEIAFSKERFIEDVQQQLEKKDIVIVAVSEGIKDQNGHYIGEDQSQSRRDAFNHPLHDGTGKILEHWVQDICHVKARSVELNVLQRCASHIASRCDLEESFSIGKAAIDACLKNETMKMMTFKRLSSRPYHYICESIDVQQCANQEKRVPLSWIHPNGHDVTEECIEYLYPLIQGEVTITYQDGIPSYLPFITHPSK